jgi:hypothetical protein
MGEGFLKNRMQAQESRRTRRLPAAAFAAASAATSAAIAAMLVLAACGAGRGAGAEAGAIGSAGSTGGAGAVAGAGASADAVAAARAGTGESLVAGADAVAAARAGTGASLAADSTAGAREGDGVGAGTGASPAAGAEAGTSAGQADVAAAGSAALAAAAEHADVAVGAVVAAINGEPVYYGELEMFAGEAMQLAGAVLSAEPGRAGAEGAAGAADAEFGDTGNGAAALAGDGAAAPELAGADLDWEPKAAYAAELAMRALVPYKIAQIGLRSGGQLEDISFGAFVREWEAENKRREEAKRNGEAVYGPIRYEKRVYYDYLQSERLSKLKELMREEPDESGMRRIYDENGALFYRFGETAMGCVTLEQGAFTESEAVERASELKSELSRGAAFEDAAIAAGVGEFAFSKVFDAASMRSPDVAAYPEIGDAIYSLPVGGVAGPIRNGDIEWIILYCESRGDSGRRSYEECRGELAQMWQEQAFEEAFEKMGRDARIQIFDGAAELFGEKGEAPAIERRE